MSKYLFVFFLCFLRSLAFSSVLIDLNAIDHELLLTPQYLDILIEPEASASIKDIIENPKYKFQKLNKLGTLSCDSCAYWVRFKTAQAGQKKFVFEVITPQTKDITFYYPSSEESYRGKITGAKYNFEQRAYAHKNFVFDLNPTFSDNQYYYARIVSDNHVGLYFKIRSQQNFSAYSLKEYSYLSIYYGGLNIICLINLLFYLVMRRQVYLVYSLTVIAGMGISLSDDGLGFAALWPHAPWITEPLGNTIFPVAFLCFYSLYAYLFLEGTYRLYFPPMLGVSLIVALSCTVVPFFSDIILFASVLYATPFLLIFGFYFWHFTKTKSKTSLFFVLGNLLAILGIVVEHLRLSNLIEANIYTVYAFEIGFLLEFVSLSASTSYKYVEEYRAKIELQQAHIDSIEENKKMQEEKVALLQEKEELSQKVNRELEEKVQQRTAELFDSNQKLKEMTNKLEAMSIELDKENWKLKIDIKTEKVQKFVQADVAFSEIQELFPSKHHCLQFLAKRKWNDAFTCSNCAHDKYSENASTLSRKCSKCGKIESVTANSLYHSQKVPLQELFYLTYLSFKKDKPDVSLLSEELGISETTIYKFIKKVKDRIADRPKANSWEELIF